MGLNILSKNKGEIIQMEELFGVPLHFCLQLSYFTHP
jgi:hypothetical protein